MTSSSQPSADEANLLFGAVLEVGGFGLSFGLSGIVVALVACLLYRQGFSRGNPGYGRELGG